MLAADAIIRTLASVNWIGDRHMKVQTGVWAAVIGRPDFGISFGGREQLARDASERGAAPTILAALL